MSYPCKRVRGRVLCFCQTRLAGKAQAKCYQTSNRSLVCYQSCEYDILKTNELILLPIGTSDPRDNSMKRPIWGSKGQISKSHEAEDKFGGLAEAPFSTPLGRVIFVVCRPTYWKFLQSPMAKEPARAATVLLLQCIWTLSVSALYLQISMTRPI